VLVIREYISKNENTYDTKTELDGADFSSMFMGAVKFSALKQLGRVKISNAQYFYDTANHNSPINKFYPVK
jgi:hypothetical protein